MSKTYDILEETSRKALVKKVEKRLDEGWQIVGRSYVDSAFFYQTIIRPPVDEDADKPITT